MFTMHSILTLLKRSIHNSASLSKKVPERLKGRSKSSQDWLIRQMNDPYVSKAKMENYRARSAFKLIEIDDKHHILQPGFTVVECGASPGAWTQVSVQRINASGSDCLKKSGKHIAVDLLPMHPVTGAFIIAPADFTAKETQDKIREHLSGEFVDIILSDMAPQATGIRQLDQDCILELAFTVFRFAKLVGKEGSNLLVKLWSGGQVSELEKNLKLHYESVKILKPHSSRQDSAEIFLLACNFRKSINI